MERHRETDLRLQALQMALQAVCADRANGLDIVAEADRYLTFLKSGPEWTDRKEAKFGRTLDYPS